MYCVTYLVRGRFARLLVTLPVLLLVLFAAIEHRSASSAAILCRVGADWTTPNVRHLL